MAHQQQYMANDLANAHGAFNAISHGAVSFAYKRGYLASGNDHMNVQLTLDQAMAAAVDSGNSIGFCWNGASTTTTVAATHSALNHELL